MKKRLIKKIKKMNYNEEIGLMKSGFNFVAGTDEAGAGSIIGPVVAAAVILDKDNLDYSINDSKKLSAKQRESLYEIIIKNCIAYSIGINSVERIDEINILWARLEAMKKAIDTLPIVPHYVIVDGNTNVPDLGIPQKAIIKGDGKCLSIAAASILAKVYRDRLMVGMSTEYPDYDLHVNKGYWCKKITAQVKKEGYVAGLHRKKFVEKILC